MNSETATTLSESTLETDNGPPTTTASIPSATPSAAPAPSATPAETLTAPPAVPEAAVVGVVPTRSWLGRNIYARNLPPVNTLTMEMPGESHVNIFFSRFGEIERVKVVRDSNTNEPIGQALVLFKKPESAQAALMFFNSGMCFWFNRTGQIVFGIASFWLPKSLLTA